MVRATNSGYTKPHAHILAPEAQHVLNYMPMLNQSPGNTIPQKDTLITCMFNHATF